MTREQKIEILEDILEINGLDEDAVLDDIESWDSVAVLCVIGEINDRFGKYPSARDILKLKTVGELLDYMQ